MNRLLLLALIGIGACEKSDEDFAHPRTAANLAHEVSWLSVPESAEVLQFEDGFVVDNRVVTQGAFVIRLRLRPADMRRAMAEAAQDTARYRRIGSSNPDSLLLPSFAGYEDAVGWYMFVTGASSKLHSQFVLLDSTRSEMILARSRISEGW